MGLIRDALGSALGGGGGLRNGFDGPQMPFTTHQRRSDYQTTNTRYSARSSPLPPSEYGSWAEQQPHDMNRLHIGHSQPPTYEQSCINPSDSRDLSKTPELGKMTSFRPLILPQIAHGDGQPFLRAYSSELQQYGVSPTDFMEALDAINVASLPNPGVQIFQKGANIAGWFLPGAASIGLMVGQVAVGVGGAYGHHALLNRVLSKANLEVFVPRGLEICIGKGQDVNNSLGVSLSLSQARLMYDASAEDRVAAYGAHVAPLDLVLPVVQGGSAGDPISMIGQGLTDRANRRKLGRARKRLNRDRSSKMDEMENELGWLMVRQATPDAISHWQNVLQQSDVSLQQDQAQAVNRQ